MNIPVNLLCLDDIVYYKAVKLGNNFKGVLTLGVVPAAPLLFFPHMHVSIYPL